MFREPSKDTSYQNTSDQKHDAEDGGNISLPAVEKDAEHDTTATSEIAKEHEHDRNVGLEDAETVFDKFASTAKRNVSTTSTDHDRSFQQQTEFEALSLNLREKERRKRGLRTAFLPSIQLILTETIEPEIEKILERMAENSQGGLTSDPDVLANLCEDFIARCGAAATSLFIRSAIDGTPSEFRGLAVEEGMEALLRAAEDRFGKDSQHVSALKSIVERRRLRLESPEQAAVKGDDPGAAPVRMRITAGTPELREPLNLNIEFGVPVEAERILTSPPAGIEIGLFRDANRPLIPSEVIAARIAIESLYREWEQTAVRRQGRRFSQYVLEYIDSRALTNKPLRAYFVDTGAALEERAESGEQLGGIGQYKLRIHSDLKLRDPDTRLHEERNPSRAIDLLPQLKTNKLETSVGVPIAPVISNGWIDSILSQFRAGKHRDSDGRPDAEVVAAIGIIADRATCPHPSSRPPSAAEMDRIRNWQRTEFSGLVREEIRSMTPEIAAQYGGIDPELQPVLVRELERAFESLGRGVVPPIVTADRAFIEGTHPYLQGEKKRALPSENTSAANLLLGTGDIVIGRSPEFFEHALGYAAHAAIQGPPANVRHPSEIANDLIRILAIPEKQQALFKSRVFVGLQSAIRKEGNEFLKKHASDIRVLLAGRRGEQREDVGSSTEASQANPLPTPGSGTASFAVAVLYRVKAAIAEQSNTDAIAAQKITRTVVADSLKEYGSYLQTQVKKFLAEDDLEGIEKLLYRAAIDQQILLPESASQEVLTETDAAIRELISSWQRERVQQQAGEITSPGKDIKALLSASSSELLFKMPEVVRFLDFKSLEEQRKLFRSAEACRAAAAELKKNIVQASDVSVRRSGETVRQVPIRVLDGELLPEHQETRIGLESRQVIEVTDATTLPDIACALFDLPAWEHLASEHFLLLRESLLQGIDPETDNPVLEELAAEAERCAVLAGERSLVRAGSLMTIPSGAHLPIGSTGLGACLRSNALESSRALLRHTAFLTTSDGTDEATAELLRIVDKEIESGAAQKERIAMFSAIGQAVAVTMSERPIGDPLRGLQKAEEAIDRYFEKFPQEAKNLKIRLAAIHLMAGKKIASAIDGADQSSAAREAAKRSYHHFTRAIELATDNTAVLAPEIELSADAAPILTIVQKAALSRGEIVSLFAPYDLEDPADSHVQAERSLASLDRDLDLASQAMRRLSELSKDAQGKLESLQAARHLLRSRALERGERIRGSGTVPLEGRVFSAEEEFYSAIDVMLGLPPSAEAFRGVGKVGGSGWVPCSELATSGDRDFLVNKGSGLAASTAHRLTGILRSAPPSKRNEVIRLIYEHGREALAHNDPAKPNADALSKAFAAVQLLDGAGDPRARVYGDLLYADFVLNTGDTYKINPWLIDISAGIDIKRDVLGTRPTKGELIDRALDISTVLAAADLVTKRYKEEIAALASQVDKANDGETKARLIEQARELERQVNENELFANEAFQRQFDAYMQLATASSDAGIKEVAAAKVRELRQVYEERADARLIELGKALEHIRTIEERVPEAAGSNGLVSEKDRIFNARDAVHERLSRMYLEEATAFSQAGHPELAKDTMELLRVAYGEGGTRGARFSVTQRLDQFSKSIGANKTAAFFQQTLAELNSQPIGEFLVYEAVGAGAGAILGLVVTLGQPAGFFAGGMIGSGAALGYLKGRSLYRGWDRITAAGAMGVTSRTAEDTLIDAVALGLDIVSLGAPLKGAAAIGRRGIKAAVGMETHQVAGELAEGIRLATREILSASEAGLRHAPLTLTQWQARREIQRSAIQEFLRVSGSFGGRGTALASAGLVGAPLAIELARIQSLDLTPEERAARYAHLISESAKGVAAFSTFFALRSAAHHAGSKEFSKTVSKYVAGVPQEVRKEIESEIAARLRQPLNARVISSHDSNSEGTVARVAEGAAHENLTADLSGDLSAIFDTGKDAVPPQSHEAATKGAVARGAAKEEIAEFLRSEVPDSINTGRYKAAKAEIERVHLERGFVEIPELEAARTGEISIPPGKSGRPITGAELERFLHEAAPESVRGQEIYKRLIERAEKRGFLYEVEITEARAGRFVPDPVAAARERVRLDVPDGGSDGTDPGRGGDDFPSYLDDLDGGSNAGDGPVDGGFDRQVSGARHREQTEGSVALLEPEVWTENDAKPQKLRVENSDRNRDSSVHSIEIEEVLVAVQDDAPATIALSEGTVVTSGGRGGTGDRNHGSSTAMHLSSPAADDTNHNRSELPQDIFAPYTEPVHAIDPIVAVQDGPPKPLVSKPVDSAVESARPLKLTVSPPLEVTIIEPERVGEPFQVGASGISGVEQKLQAEEVSVLDSQAGTQLDPVAGPESADQVLPSPLPQPQLEAQSVKTATRTKERDADWSFSNLLDKLEQKQEELNEPARDQTSKDGKPKAKQHFGKKIRKAIVTSGIGARVVDESEVPNVQPEPLSVIKITINEGRDG